MSRPIRVGAFIRKGGKIPGRARVATDGIAPRAVPLPANLKAVGQTRAGRLNKTEQAYQDNVLEVRRRAGEVAWYAYEALKLRLADSTFYTTDFTVMLADGRLEIHEVKGFMQDDAAVKLKVAAASFPFRFYLVRKARGGGWSVDEV